MGQFFKNFQGPVATLTDMCKQDSTDKNDKLILWRVLPPSTVTLSHTELFMTANFQVLHGQGRHHLRLTRTPVESATPTQV